MASCFDAFKECRGGGVRALLFAVQISSHVSLFPSFISPVIIDTSCYWFTTGEFPSFEGYVFASNNLLNHTINEIGLFFAFFFFLASRSVCFFSGCFTLSVSLFRLVGSFLVSTGILVSLRYL